jgi:predicted nucleic acid-binding protein
VSRLLDTDIIVDLTRNNPAAIEYIDSLEGDWTISALTSLELVAGARDKLEVASIDAMIAKYSEISPDEGIARRAYLLLKTHAKSHGLRTIDSLIAATALERGLTLATRNKRHFQMIPGLSLDVPGY